MPVGPAVGAVPWQDEEPPVAIACVANGRDARRCPECGREFLMKTAFLGKVIRCRGCRKPFRVTASPRAIGEPVDAADEQIPEARPRPPAPVPQRPQPPEKPKPPRPSTTMPRPTIFEDIGDILEDLTPGERVASVIRPKNAAKIAKADSESLASLVAIVLGGVCAIPMTLVLLRITSPKEFENLAASLPDFLTAWLR